MKVYLNGIGLLAPGLPDWATAVPLLANPAAYTPGEMTAPVVTLLPAGERRRSSYVTKLAVHAANEAVNRAGLAPDALATVFASANGDGDTIHAICEVLAGDDRLVSPTRFHNSVHNAAAGYWGIATGSRQASTSLAGWDDSFAMGLLEAALQVRADETPVLLAAYDAPFPEPLARARPTPHAFATALVLTPVAEAGSIAELTLALDGTVSPTRMGHEPLEALRTAVAAARSLPLLAAVAAARETVVVLDYAGDRSLRIGVRPWG